MLDHVVLTISTTGTQKRKKVFPGKDTHRVVSI